MVFGAGGAAYGQVPSRTYPKPAYYSAMSVYYSGEFQDAENLFRQAARGGYAVGSQRWIDSVCYYTMIGECYYRMGNLPQAMTHYESALKVLMSNQGWVARIQFPDNILPSSSAVGRANINWGKTTRTTTIGNFPDNFNVLTGDLRSSEEVLTQGGLVSPTELRQLNAVEVFRCACLAMSRRRQILGPVAMHDPMTNQLITSLGAFSTGANHWASPWEQMLLAMANGLGGEFAKSADGLINSLVIARQYDHPLTPIGLLELGRLYFEQDQFDKALPLLMEATYSGAIFEQHDVVEEAFRLATHIHLITRKTGVFPPLIPAATWARAKSSKQTQAAIFLLTAECQLAEGLSRDAQKTLSYANRPMLRNDLAASDLGLHQKYLLAHSAFQSGDPEKGMSLLASSMTQMAAFGKWLYQISATDQMAANGQISTRVADLLFDNLLREPTSKDWLIEPIETLSIVLIQHQGPMYRWFELAMSRKEDDKAIWISEKIRRHRFYSTLPLGGRLLALRWVLEAAPAALTGEAQAQRQDFLLRYPAYAKASQESKEIRAQLERLPPISDDATAEAATQKKLFAQLKKISVAQEAVLGDIALRREPSDFVFPPLLTFDDIQSKLQPQQAILSYFSTTRAVYVFIVSKQKYGFQRITEPAAIKPEMQQFFRKIGCLDQNAAVPAAAISSDAWRQHAQNLTLLLLPEFEPSFWDDFEELIVVPDDILWYFPFEVMQFGTANRPVNLVEKLRIRYAPTLATAFPDRRGNPPKGNTAIVTGRLFPRDEFDVSQEVFDEIKRDMPEAVQLSGKLPAPPSQFISVCERLVVLDDIKPSSTGPYAWGPVQMDRNREGVSLASWMGLPWNGPDQVLLPGFHTTAESALKQQGRGNELFLAACGMMATGSRTLLISRWRTGGQSSFNLMTELVRELPRRSASHAWQRSLELTFESEIDPEAEPRINEAAIEEPVSGSHPFFWSGYMLFDTGTVDKE